MRIAIAADLHGTLPEIEPCDLLIIAGDITGGNWGGAPDPPDKDAYWYDWYWRKFIDWAESTPARQIFAIAGNHDTALIQLRSDDYVGNHRFQYLCDEGDEFEGLKIWGSPWTRTFGNLAFECSEAELNQHWDKIPEKTDILVVHQPPYGVGDCENGRNLGSLTLRAAIECIKPKLVATGHIHGGRGIYRLDDTVVVNAALEPITIEL